MRGKDQSGTMFRFLLASGILGGPGGPGGSGFPGSFVGSGGRGGSGAPGREGSTLGLL